MSGQDKLQQMFEGMNLEWAESPFDEKPVDAAQPAAPLAKQASVPVALEPSGVQKATSAKPPSAILQKKRDVETAPVRMVADAVEDDEDDVEEGDFKPAPSRQTKRTGVTFDELYDSLMESRAQSTPSQTSRFFRQSDDSFRGEARENAARQSEAAASAVEVPRASIASHFAAAPSASSFRFATAEAKPTTEFRLSELKPIASGAELSEEQHFDAAAGVEAIKRTAADGTPARIHVALTRTDKLELLAKRSTTEPNTMLYATRLNDYSGSSAPIPLMKTDLKTGLSTSFASWANTHDGLHSSKLLLKATKVIEDMITEAGVYDVSNQTSQEKY